MDLILIVLELQLLKGSTSVKGGNSQEFPKKNIKYVLLTIIYKK